MLIVRVNIPGPLVDAALLLGLTMWLFDFPFMCDTPFGAFEKPFVSSMVHGSFAPGTALAGTGLLPRAEGWMKELSRSV
jgi:hypothetical protein